MIKSILVDNREPPHVQNISFPNVPVMKMQLETGDLWVKCEDGNTLIVERKEPTDLMASIADNRLFNQAAKMRQVSNWCYVVVTGKIDDANFIDDTGRKWTYASIWGALLSVQEMGVMIIFCNGEDDFGPCIERLAKRNRGDIKVNPVRPNVIFGGAEATLMTIPGIGQEKIYGNKEKQIPGFLEMFAGSLGLTIMGLSDVRNTRYIPNWGEKSAQNVINHFQYDFAASLENATALEVARMVVEIQNQHKT